MTPDCIVGVGALRLAAPPERLRALGVGSCLAVTLWDRARRCGALAHVPLPRRESEDDPPQQFVDSALRLMVDELARRGAPVCGLEAKAAGGASLLRGNEPSRALPIAVRNLEALYEVLAELGVPLVASDLGGCSARSIEFDPESGKLSVLSLPDRLLVL
jgi:chemotaxis protein CheD